MYCTQCGNKLVGEGAYCANCGTEVRLNEAPSANVIYHPNQTPRVESTIFGKVNRALAPISTAIGLIKSIVDGVHETVSNVRDTVEIASGILPFLGPLTYYVGVVAIATYIRTYIFMLIVRALFSKRLQANQLQNTYVAVVSISAIWSFVQYVLMNENPYIARSGLAIFAQIIGAAVIFYGVYVGYTWKAQKSAHQG